MKVMTNEKVSLRDIYEEIQSFREEIREIYVTKEQFAPVEKIVYSAVGLMLLTLVGAMVARVVQAAPF